MTAMAMAESSGQRFVLGLGTANAQLNESALGLGKVSPLAWMAEYVAVVRHAFEPAIRFGSRGSTSTSTISCSIALARAPCRSILVRSSRACCGWPAPLPTESS